MFLVKTKRKEHGNFSKRIMKSVKVLLRNKPLNWLQILLATLITIRSSKSLEIARCAMSVLDRCNSARRLLG